MSQVANKLGGLVAVGGALVILAVIGKVVGGGVYKAPLETNAVQFEQVELEKSQIDQKKVPVNSTSTKAVAGTNQAKSPSVSFVTSGNGNLPKARTAAEILRIQKFVPSEVILTADTAFPLTNNGRTAGYESVKRGARAKVAGLSGEKVVLQYNQRTQIVPIGSTDFLERVVAEASK